MMEDIQLFLAHAIQLERDAAHRFTDLMHSMRTLGDGDVEALFRRLGELSRMHLKSAMERGGFRKLPELSPEEFQWPEGVTPEAAGWHGVDSMIGVSQALELALAGEQSGHDYYSAVAQQTADPEVREMAELFASEEAEHVAELQRWIARYAA